MTTAIFFGNREIVQILEYRGIKNRTNSAHIEAAILSYRNIFAKEMIENLNENDEQIQNILNICIITSLQRIIQNILNICIITSLQRIIQKR